MEKSSDQIKLLQEKLKSLENLREDLGEEIYIIKKVKIEQELENLIIANGDVIKRNKKVSADRNNVAIGGNAHSVNIASGENSTAGSFITLQEEYVQYIFEKIETLPETTEIDKEDLKTAVEEIRREDRKGTDASESFIGQRLRNISRIAPNILDVVLAVIGNPVAGFGMVVKKVAERMKEDANS